jgi:hypothetical protein
MLTVIIIVLLVLLLTGWFGYSRRGRRSTRPENARSTVGHLTVLRAPRVSAYRRSLGPVFEGSCRSRRRASRSR